MSEDMRFNRQKFVIASAKSQSGNLLGMAVGAFVVAFSGTASAPVLLFALAGGVAVQMIWGGTGMGDLAGSIAERALKP